MLSEQEVSTLLEDILENENLSNGKLEISSGSQKGDGYLSCMTKVSISNSKKKLNLIIKCAPRNETIRDILPLNLCYMREIYFYNEIYPLMKKIQLEKKMSDPFKSVAHCYKTQSEEFCELLVLENICESGFRLWDRRSRMNDAHIKLGFAEYAKFHAISFALKDQQKMLYDNLTENLYDTIIKFNCDFIPAIIAVVDSVKELFCNEGERDIQDALIKLKYEIEPLFRYMGENKPYYNVINHGDCWGNNLMFKYEGNDPLEIRMLDFQIIRAASPVLDLAYFFYANSSDEVYDNLDYHLNDYYYNFCRHLKAMGSDPKILYPLKVLKNNWKRYCVFGFLLGLLIQKNLLNDDDEIIDFIDIAESGENLKDLFLKKGKHDELINQRRKKLVLHVYNSGFI